MPTRNRTNALPFAALSKEDQHEARLRVIRHIRQALRLGPHSVLELREGIAAADFGALPSSMDALLNAGEVAPLGHCVYARVPWMPQMRPVKANPVRDLVLATLASITQPSANNIATSLDLPLETVTEAITELQQLGLVEEYKGTYLSGRYRCTSPRMGEHVRRGARGRVFADTINPQITPASEVELAETDHA